MKEQEIKKAIKEGSILTKVTFEVQGRPKEHVEETLKKYIESIKNQKELTITNEFTESAEKIEEEKDIWSSFAELDILIKDIKHLTWISVNFLPASIEIIEPTNFNISAHDLQDWNNDVLARLHEIDKVNKNIMINNQNNAKNINIIIKNFIINLIRTGIQDTNIMEKITGVREENIKKFLKHIEETDKLIKKEGDKYVFIKQK